MLVLKSKIEIVFWQKIFVATLDMDMEDRAKTADRSVEMLRERIPLDKVQL